MEDHFTADIKQRIVSYLDAAEATAGTAGEFVVEQTPIVAQEYLAWTFWSGSIVALVFFSIGALGVAVCFRVAIALWKGEKDDVQKNGGPPVAAVPAFLGVLIGFVFGLASAAHAGDALKVCIAPRVVLMEKAAEMLP